VRLIGAAQEVDTLLSHRRMLAPRQSPNGQAPPLDPDARLQARRHLWVAAGLDPPPDDNPAAVSGDASAPTAGGGLRPGGRADDFPIDTQEVSVSDFVK
jgi:hypothetical protein